MIRVLPADDEAVIRAGVRAILYASEAAMRPPSNLMTLASND